MDFAPQPTASGYNDSILDPSLDWDAQQQQITQAQARIKALRDLANQGPVVAERQPGWTSALTGAKMLSAQPRISALGAIAPLIEQYGADQGDRQIAQATSDLTSAENKQITDVMGNLPKGTPAVPATAPTAGTEGTPEVPPSLGPYGVNLPGAPAQPGTPASAGTAYQPAQPASQASISAALAPLMSNPLGRSLALDKLKDLAINEPERQAQREQTAAQAAATLAEKRDEFYKGLDEKREQYKATLANQFLTHQMMAQIYADRMGGGTPITDNNGLIWINRRDGTQVPAVDPSSGEQLGAKPTAQGAKMWEQQQTSKLAASEGEKLLDRIWAEGQKATSSGLGAIRDQLGNIIGWGGSDQNFANAIKANAAMLSMQSILASQGGPNSNKNLRLHQDYFNTLADPTISLAAKKQTYLDAKANFQYMQKDTSYTPVAGFKPPGGTGVTPPPAPPVRRSGTPAPAPAATPAPAPANAPLPSDEAGYRQAVQAARDAYQKSPSADNKNALDAAQTDLVRFQAQGNAPAPAPEAPKKNRKYNPATDAFE